MSLPILRKTLNRCLTIFSNVKQMRDLGLDVQQVTYLAHLLREKGIEISKEVLTVDDCIRELDRLCR